MAPKKKRIKTNLFLDAEDYQKLKNLSKSLLGNPPVSALIRDAIKAFIKQHKA